MPITTDDAKALEALVSWWAEAGVDTPPPIGAPRTAPPRDGRQSSVQDRPQPAPKPPAPKAAPTRSRPSPRPKTSHPTAPGAAPGGPANGSARESAARAKTLADLKAALEAFSDHPLHGVARNTVFARGRPDARVMVIGEAPGKDEDIQGLPFVGRSGQLLDKMFAAIGLTAEAERAEDGLYISNILNWRPPGNRNPSADEIALCLPFIQRHIALAQPKILVLTGGVSAQTLLKSKSGIMRLRGTWTDYAPDADLLQTAIAPIPTLPIYHPAFVLRRPIAKREVWADLLSLRARLERP